MAVWAIDLIGAMRNTTLEIKNFVDDYTQEYADKIPTEFYDEAISKLQEGRDMMDEQESNVATYEVYRATGTWMYFVIFGGSMLAYFVFSCLMFGFFTYVLSLVFWLFSIISWICLAVFLPISVAMGDICYEIDLIVKPQGNETESVMDNLIQCIDEAQISGFRSNLDVLELGIIGIMNYQAANMSLITLNAFPYMNFPNPVFINETNLGMPIYRDVLII